MKRQGFALIQMLEIIIISLALTAMFYAMKADLKYQAEFDRILRAHPECITAGSGSNIRACVNTFKRLEKLK